MLEAQQLLGDLVAEELDRILIAEPVAARNRVVAMFVDAIVFAPTPAAPPSAETVWLRIG
jgi:hypothetical protein